MISRYLVFLVVMLLFSFGCITKAPVSTPSIPPEDSTSVTITTPDSVSGISPSERVPRVTVDELLQKIESNADIMIVDTRVDVETEFALGHIKGAVPVPLTEIISGQWIPSADKEIILYCT